MQHYGAPTRLLDWTYSFYVALFFAVEKSSQSSQIWALDMSNYQVVTNEEAENSIKSRWEIQKCKLQSVFANDNPKLEVVAVNPYLLNQRLSIQQGLFLMPYNITESFKANLFQGKRRPTKKTMIRFEIRPGIRKEILQNLHQMNINRATLFPGLEGFAQSLWTRLAVDDRMSAV